MKKLSAVLAIVLPVVAQGQSRFELSIPNIMRGPEVYGREPQNPRFTPNGEWLYFNWLPPGTDWRETTKPYRVRAQAGATPERVTDAHMDSVGPSLAQGVLSRDGSRRASQRGLSLVHCRTLCGGARAGDRTPADSGRPAPRWSRQPTRRSS